MFDELNPDALDANTRDRLSQPVSLVPADQGTFHNFWKGAGTYTMRGLAEAGRAVDMAGAAWPVALDKLNGNTSYQDDYFKTHDEVFNRAVDRWTPQPGEVGKAGEITGQLVSGVLQTVIDPALLVGTAQLGGAEDLNRQGVDATTANLVGTVQGAATAVGVKLPYLGKTLASRMTSGVAGNVAQGLVARGASGEILKLRGYDQQAGQFDAWDMKSMALDALMGAAFGGLAHIEARGMPKQFTPEQQDALLTVNQARHLDNETAPGLPETEADLNQHVNAMREAVDQTLRGEPVNVDAETQAMRMVPDPALDGAREGVGREIAKAVFDNYYFASERAQEKFAQQLSDYKRGQAEELVRPAGESGAGSQTARGAEQRAFEKFRAQMEAMTKPIETPPPPETSIPLIPPTETKSTASDTQAKPEAPPTDPAILKARQAVAENPDMVVPTGDANPDGTPGMTRAGDALKAVDTEAAQAQATAPGLLQTVAHCLLGIL